MSKCERSGWRDAWISERHRQWSSNCPAVDLDNIVTREGEDMGENGWNVCEYDNKEPVALIEYKHRGAKVRINDANNTTLRRLADRAGLPCFIVVYEPSSLRFGVIALNELAQSICPERVVYSESDYKSFLLRLRGRVAL